MASCRVWLISGESYVLPYATHPFEGFWRAAIENNKMIVVPGRDEMLSPHAVVRVSAS